MGITKIIFGDRSNREIRKIMPVVKKIESQRETMHALSDADLRAKTIGFKERLARGETLDGILPDAFAVVREAGLRVLNMEHFPVQLIGGIILHQGRVAEMKTGEGKTLVCTLPSYLHALEGKGVYVVTVNDYLAKRDAEQMGQLHRFLGLTTGCITQDMTPEQRKTQYACDITYITNNELGFDYLRDNMAIRKEDQVQRGLHYAIIDEVDSILIDEARTPLIISGSSGKPTGIYNVCDIFAKSLKKGKASGELTKSAAIVGERIEETGDFIVYEKEKNVVLTADGIKKAERFFNIRNFSDADHIDLQHHTDAALRANYLMHRDQDYVVSDGEVLIVDSFTGRIMPGRRFSDGIHQAIEAKEHVKIKQDNRTLATITFQNFFNKFDLKCGMTGTAKTEEQEFRDIYGMDVVSVPTNRPVIRQDLDDAVFHTKAEKDRAIVRAVREAHEKHQPVLVGTVNIDVSEHLSELLKAEGIPHNVLNAKYHAQEAEIVQHAGEADAVTIATNMAGRGTDIKLDEVARTAGGLYVIGTERHESRRIDNQLRGRSGRQGDPGKSKFFICLEDDLMRLFTSDRVRKVFEAAGLQDEPIEHKMLNGAIRRAQEKIESNHFAARKNLLDFDRVNNDQREVIYNERQAVLDGKDISDVIRLMMEETVDRIVDNAFSFEYTEAERLDYINAAAGKVFNIEPLTGEEFRKNASKKKITAVLIGRTEERYKKQEKQYQTEEQVRNMERVVLLKVIDAHWTEHIDAMEQLRQSVHVSAYGQRDPRIEYQMKGSAMFDRLIECIQEHTLELLYHAEIPKPKPSALQVRKVFPETRKESEEIPVKEDQAESVKDAQQEPARCLCPQG